MLKTAIVGSLTGKHLAIAAAIVLSLLGSYTLIRDDGPNHDQMLEAFENHRVSQLAHYEGEMEKVEAGEITNGPAIHDIKKAVAAFSQPRLDELKKYACVRADGQPGHICDYTVTFINTNGRIVGDHENLLRARFYEGPNGLQLTQLGPVTN